MSDHVTAWDRLIEQQEQELVRDGVVSAFTQQQLQAYAEGKPIPHVWDSPQMQLATARLLQTLKRSPVPSTPGDDDDDMWFDDEDEE